jgi:rod shape-determining protein MreD
MRSRNAAIVAAALLSALVLQASVFGRLRIGTIAPDLVLIALLLTSFRMGPSTGLIVAFLAGLALDAWSAQALGLRAMVYTAVMFVATRTRERADAGPVATAMWIGVLTFIAVVLLGLVGTLFGQLTFSGGQMLSRILVIPLLNLILGLILVPAIARIQAPSRRYP